MPISKEVAAYLRRQEPGKAVLNALATLLANDAFLLEADANERSISHRFAMYLQVELADWHVDCEYNRDGFIPKRVLLADLETGAADTDATSVFPDVIAHHRNTAENFLVIEIKKSTNGDDRNFDYMKLSAYKDDLGYQFALFIEFLTGRQSGIGTVEWL